MNLLKSKVHFINQKQCQGDGLRWNNCPDLCEPINVLIKYN